MKVGSPPRTVRLLVDTGSDETTISSKSINAKVSSSFRLLRAGDDLCGKVCLSMPYGTPGDACVFKVGYLKGGSTAGQYARDVTFLAAQNGQSRALEFSFGHVLSGLGSIIKNSEGVLGLGLRREGTHNPPSFLERVWNGSGGIFSLCLGFGSGRLSFGGPNVDLHVGGAKPLTLTSRSTSPDSSFIIKLSSIHVEGVGVFSSLLPVPSFTRSVILDSGANQIIVPTQIYVKLENAFKIFCSRAQKNCGGYNSLQENFNFSPGSDLTRILETFPRIKFVFFGDQSYFLHPKSYLKNMQGYLQSGFLPGEDTDGKGFFLFGTPFMRGNDFIFDSNRREVTIVKANCERRN